MAKTRKNGLSEVLLFIVVVVIVIWLMRRKTTTTIPQSNPPPQNLPTISSSVSYSSTQSDVQTVISSTTNLTGAAPSGAKWGINTTTGKTFYVDSLGEWQESVLPITASTPITATVNIPQLNNSQSYSVDVAISGVLMANHYNIKVVTDLQNFNSVEFSMTVVANNTVRVVAKNNTGSTVTLPEITISALKLS